MSDYPEHDKLTAVQDETQAAGDFVSWLAGQGIQLMRWSENLKDWHPVSDTCRAEANPPGATCCPRRWRNHCTHWTQDKDTCCRCGLGQMQEVTFTGWVADGRNLTQLLADWQGIDLARIETEKRQILASLQAANGG
jgi:hypothetical protein